MTTILITSLVVAAVGLIAMGLLLPRLGHDRLAVRLATLAERPRTLEEVELDQPFGERVWQPLMDRLTSLGQRLLGRGAGKAGRENPAEKIRRRLALAGTPHRCTPADWLGWKLLVALCVGGLCVLAFWSLPLVFRVLIMVGGGYAGYILPEFWLKRQIGARQKAIRRALPDVLDLLVISVQGGLGFDAAVNHVAAQAENPLTEELTRMLAEMRVGRTRREAMRGVIERTEVPELSQFIWTLIQADQLGVSVVQVLVAQAQLMRVQRRQRIQEQAQKAPLKMIMPLGIFIFPALCIVLLGPAVPALQAAFRR
jgi:tight adherence protein C